MAGERIRKAKVSLPPVVKSDTLNTNDLEDRTQTTSAVAEFGRLVTPQVLQPETEEVLLASPADIDKAYADELKFNEELVEITIHDDTSEFPVDPVSMSNNGKQIFVKRGVPTKIPRKFVESLCSPVVRVTTKQTKNNLGEDATELAQHRALQYPFSLNDPNPRGREWLRSLLRRG